MSKRKADKPGMSHRGYNCVSNTHCRPDERNLHNKFKTCCCGSLDFSDMKKRNKARELLFKNGKWAQEWYYFWDKLQCKTCTDCHRRNKILSMLQHRGKAKRDKGDWR